MAAVLGASPRGTVLRIQLEADPFKRRCVLLSDLPGGGMNLNYIWRLGVVVLSTEAPESEWHPRVASTPLNGLPAQHAYRALTDTPLAIKTDEVIKVGGPIAPAEMDAIDRVMKTLYGL